MFLGIKMLANFVRLVGHKQIWIVPNIYFLTAGNLHGIMIFHLGSWRMTYWIATTAPLKISPIVWEEMESKNSKVQVVVQTFFSLSSKNSIVCKFLDCRIWCQKRKCIPNRNTFCICFWWGGHCCPIHCNLLRSIVLPRI